jgi:Transposase IS66 family
MWSLARDDRPWGGCDPPAVAYTYAPGRGGTHAVKLLAGFSGILQVDGYSVYKQLLIIQPARRHKPHRTCGAAKAFVLHAQSVPLEWIFRKI